MNWKHILKKHLNTSKKNCPYFVILNNSRRSLIMNITDSVKKFTIEDFLIALSLQGQDKVSNFKEENIPFQFNFSCPYEKFTITFFEDKTFHHFTIERYTLMNPATAEEENIHDQENQAYIFQYNSEKENYNSGVLSPLQGDKIIYKSFPLYIKIIDHSVELHMKKNELVLKYNEKVFRLPLKEKKPKVQKNNSLEFEYYHNHYYSTNKGIIEHTIKNYQVFLIKTMVYNIVRSIVPEQRHEKVRFVLFLKGENLNIEIQIKNKEEKFKVQNFFSQTELTILEKKKGIPFTWKIQHKNKNFYIKPLKDFIHKETLMKKCIVVPVEILTRGGSSHEGIGWIQYENIEEEKQEIQRKINHLYKPLERPNVEYFCSEIYPIESLLPTFFFIFSIIVTVIFVVLFICTSETSFTS